jgi:hydrogenase maturation factor HypF (carbamoyltransferase family)
MSRKHLQDLIKNLQEFYKCPSCDTSYHLDDISYLGELNQYYFVQLSCHECSMPVLATVSIGGKVVKRSKTDLRQAEEAKFVSMGEISAGEIADFHRYISRKKGGFTRHR